MAKLAKQVVHREFTLTDLERVILTALMHKKCHTVSIYNSYNTTQTVFIVVTNKCNERIAWPVCFQFHYNSALALIIRYS